MKALLVLIALFPLVSFCQIDIMQQSDAARTKPRQYDSGYNYNLTPGWDMREIIGQKLTFLPHSKKYVSYTSDPNFCACYVEVPVRVRTPQSIQDEATVRQNTKSDPQQQSGGFPTGGISSLFHKKSKSQGSDSAASAYPLTSRDSATVSNYKPVLVPKKSRTTYQPDVWVTDSNAVENKTFVVVDVIDNKAQPNGRRKIQFMYQPGWDVLFKLKTLDNSDSLLLGVTGDRVSNQGPAPVSSFVINGYYEKLKAMYTGRKFYARKKLDQLMLQDGNDQYNLLLDPYTGEKITIDSTNEEWECEKVTFVETGWNKYPVLSLLLKNGDRHFALDVSRTDLAINSDYFKTEREFQFEKMLAAEKAKKEEEEREEARKQAVADSVNREKMRKENIAKYGSRIGGLINEGKVAIGMTKEQCARAWGDPSYINTTTTANNVYQQWVYGGSYLYFTNDTLTDIQN